jgi:suppressor for copper-sensitivity B
MSFSRSNAGSRRFARIAAFVPFLALTLAAQLSADSLSQASAAESPWVASEAARVRLITAASAVGGAEPLVAGLQVELAEGWKTYWRTPGEAGLPPELDWSASENLRSVRMQWPAPHRFTLFGIDTVGYRDAVVFPLEIEAADSTASLRLRPKLDLLVCSNICIPATFDLALDLPVGAAVSDSAASNMIARALAEVPGEGQRAGITVEGLSLDGTGESVILEARARVPFEQPDIFLEQPDGIGFAAPRIRLSDNGHRLWAELAVTAWPTGADLLAQPLTATLVDGDRAIEWRGAARSLPSTGLRSVISILGLALLGGLILNLMPCVLPVLSLKLLSVVKQSGRARREVRLGFLASAAGIVTSFLLLAGVLAGLKATGASIGWGIQFQQPIFLVFMIVVLTLFAANLLGLFEIILPAWLNGRLASAGLEHQSLPGHFLTGAFATLLATPCSAPFLGTAVGFALSQGAMEIFAVFTALGLGLALPYLTVALFPGIAGRLPRPGRWMITLKRLLCLALAATVLWLLSVLTTQAGWPAAVVIGGLMILLSGLLWIRHRGRETHRKAVLLAGCLVVLLAFVSPYGVKALDPKQAPPSVALGWQPFDPSAIKDWVELGQPVFVDVTAEWCITCQVNKALVLERGVTAELLSSGAVVAMQADWTNPDPKIATYLAGFGRYGIPFNVVYGPEAQDGIVLPEILTSATVTEAIATAVGVQDVAALLAKQHAQTAITERPSPNSPRLRTLPSKGTVE